jgi:ABC-type microcin C transport system duplicated ATPase subunit YejF
VRKGETLGVVGNPVPARPRWPALHRRFIRRADLYLSATTSRACVQGLLLFRRDMQIVFQDRSARSHRASSVGDIVAEG